MKTKFKVLNADGSPVILNSQEKRIAEVNQRLANDLGYQIDVTTLTGIIKRVTTQKFFQVAFADYLPVKVGEMGWMADLTTYRSFSLGGAFSAGVINMAENNGRLAEADAGVDSLTVKVFNWAKAVGYTIPELEMASKSGNWDLITARQDARKKNWDLGLQELSFLGLKDDANCLGLLTQAISPNTSFIDQPISAMSPDDLKVFCAGILDLYRTRCYRTAWPTHFIIPESDYNGLASQSSPDFPVKSTLQLLEEMFQTITQNKAFRILPIAYADVAYSNGVLSHPRYTLLNYDEESIRMDIPVQYTATVANSLNGFQFQNVGYGQFTGALAYRPLELMYLDNQNG